MASIQPVQKTTPYAFLRAQSSLIINIYDKNWRITSPQTRSVHVLYVLGSNTLPEFRAHNYSQTRYECRLRDRIKCHGRNISSLINYFLNTIFAVSGVLKKAPVKC